MAIGSVDTGRGRWRISLPKRASNSGRYSSPNSSITFQVFPEALPGHTALTRTLLGHNSTAMLRTAPSMPAFAAP